MLGSRDTQGISGMGADALPGALVSSRALLSGFFWTIAFFHREKDWFKGFPAQTRLVPPFQLGNILPSLQRGFGISREKRLAGVLGSHQPH